MSISNVSNGWTGAKQYAARSKKTESADTFADKVQKAADSQEAAAGAACLWPGDMVIPQPPGYFDSMCNSSVTGKSRDEMTMDEYKQWVRSEIAQMPVSSWYRATCVGGALVITEEAFERMKSDPEWESTVLNMVRRMYSVNGLMGSKMIGYQVIGASPQECYGAAMPVKSNDSHEEESWREKRHKRYKEILKEQLKEASQRAHAQREAAQQAALAEHLKGQKIRQRMMWEKLQKEQGIVHIQSFLDVADANAAAAAYVDVMDIFGGGVNVFKTL